MLHQFLAQAIAGINTSHQGNVGIDTLTLYIVWVAHNRCFGHSIMQYQCALHLSRTHSMTGYINHIIDTPGYPVIAVFIPTGTVTTEIFAGIYLEIGFNKALMITINGAHHSWPGAFDTECALGGTLQLLALVINQTGFNTEEWQRGRTRFQWSRTG